MDKNILNKIPNLEQKIIEQEEAMDQLAREDELKKNLQDEIDFNEACEMADDGIFDVDDEQ